MFLKSLQLILVLQSDSCVIIALFYFCSKVSFFFSMTKLDSQGNVLEDQSPCAGVRADLKLCLLDSECVKKEHKTPKECLISANCPTECQALRNLLFECKRSLLDTRQRFRGRKGY